MKKNRCKGVLQYLVEQGQAVMVFHRNYKGLNLIKLMKIQYIAKGL